MGLPLRNDSGDANGKTKKGVVAAEEEDNDNEDDDSVEDMFDPKKRANRPATEDILRELDMKTKAQKRKDKLIEAKQEKKKQKRELAAKDAEDEESSSDEEEVLILIFLKIKVVLPKRKQEITGLPLLLRHPLLAPNL